MIYAIIDTNVVVSAMINWQSVSGAVVEAALCGDIIPVLQKDILKEYEDVLNLSKFQFDKQDIKNFLEGIRDAGVYIEPEPCPLHEEKDRIFYILLLAANQQYDTYLVTDNLRHFSYEPFIITPAEMCIVLDIEPNKVHRYIDIPSSGAC